MRIFVVDDDRDLAESLAEVLELSGHEVEIAFSGEEAVEVFREKDFDVSFMDVVMPGMNGVESFLEIRKIKPDAKVFMLTGDNARTAKAIASEVNVDGVLKRLAAGFIGFAAKGKIIILVGYAAAQPQFSAAFSL